MRPRVGHIQFLNCLPIYYGLVKGSGILDLDLMRGTPTELNTWLVEGRLDISPVSSIHYARHCDDLLLLPGPTVSCTGPVRSILLASRVPAEELGGKKVGLTSTSATSQVLLKILLEKGRGVKPEYFPYGEDLDGALGEGDAALLIGDNALKQAARPGERLFVYDLGEEWRRHCGLGMVFAVWAVRRDFARRNMELVTHVWSLFDSSIEYCNNNLREIALDSSRWEIFSHNFLEQYFRTLTFGFDEALQKGLLRFFDEAAAQGELKSTPPLNFFQPLPSGALCRPGVK